MGEHMNKIVKKEDAIEPIVEGVPTTTPISDLAKKIDALSGLQKQEFCKTLNATEKKNYISYLKDRDMEEVECIFRCNEPVGGSVTVSCKPYEGCEYTNTFNDGQTYMIPLYLAKRMNTEYQGCGTWYPTHSYILDASGKPVVGTGKKNYRFGFNSTQFA